MTIKIERKWTDKNERFTFGQDKFGHLYCKDNETNVNLTLLDPYYKKGRFFYYKFVNPITKIVKLVKR